MLFQLVPRETRTIGIQIGKKVLGFRNMQDKLEKVMNLFVKFVNSEFVDLSVEVFFIFFILFYFFQVNN